MACLLGVFETILTFLGAAFPKALIVAPLRLLCISGVLVTTMWLTRPATRTTA